jgi:hypothetical protein
MVNGGVTSIKDPELLLKIVVLVLVSTTAKLMLEQKLCGRIGVVTDCSSNDIKEQPFMPWNETISKGIAVLLLVMLARPYARLLAGKTLRDMEESGAQEKPEP